jgi:hypothetical protein
MTDWLLSTLWYVSFVALIVAVLAVIRPLRWLRLRTRGRAVAVILVTLALIVGTATCGPRTEAVFLPQTNLDAVAPVYQFREVHSVMADATPASVMRAVKTVAADEIAFFRSLTAIRRLGRPRPESILTAPAGEPILEVATRTGFIVLADDAREFVLGSVLAARDLAVRARIRESRSFQELVGPGIIKATLNFRAEATPNGMTRLSTETRVFCSDDDALRRFTPYWRTIFPGSWILRVMWLRAIARRAEADRPSPIAQP